MSVSLEDRLKFGSLTIGEICALRPVSRSGFYKDLHRGLVAIEKKGRKSTVRGPIAQKYLAGEPIHAVSTRSEAVDL
jgi:hypothetical protein